MEVSDLLGELSRAGHRTSWKWNIYLGEESVEKFFSHSAAWANFSTHTNLQEDLSDHVISFYLFIFFLLKGSCTTGNLRKQPHHLSTLDAIVTLLHISFHTYIWELGFFAPSSPPSEAGAWHTPSLRGIRQVGRAQGTLE